MTLGAALAAVPGIGGGLLALALAAANEAWGQAVAGPVPGVAGGGHADPKKARGVRSTP